MKNTQENNIGKRNIGKTHRKHRQENTQEQNNGKTHINILVTHTLNNLGKHT